MATSDMKEMKTTSLGLFHQLAIRSATLKRRDLLHTLHRHGIKKDDERIKVRQGFDDMRWRLYINPCIHASSQPVSFLSILRGAHPRTLRSFQPPKQSLRSWRGRFSGMLPCAPSPSPATLGPGRGHHAVGGALGGRKVAALFVAPRQALRQRVRPGAGQPGR